MPTKVCLVKAMVFPVVMYGCESWTIKKAEHWRIIAFELWCWRRLLRVPWTVRRSNQSILKEISPGCSFEGLMLKLKLQYFGHLMRRTGSFEKTLMLGKIEGRRRTGWDGWMTPPTQWTWVWVGSGNWWCTGRPGMLQLMGLQRVRHDLAGELNWTAPWKKSCDKPRLHIEEQRHHFANKGSYSQSYGFSSRHVQMWELDHKEGWVPKNSCFKTVVLEKTLESPWTSRSNRCILKEISPEYSLEGLMLKLKLQYFGHLMWRTDLLERPWCWERLRAGGEGNNRGWNG